VTSGEKIELIIKQLGLTVNSFALKMGRKPTIIYNIISGRNNPGLDVISDILKTYNLSAEWFINDVGEPFVKQSQEPVKQTLTIKEPDQEYLTGKNTRVLAITQDSRGKENIEMVQSKAAASYIDNLQTPEFIGNLPKMFIPAGQLQGGTFRGFEVKGNSMEPTLQNGSIVIGRFVDNWIRDIKDDWIYIIVSQEAILVKRVLNRIEARKQLYLKSDNYEYEPRNIDIDEVKEVWMLKAELRYNFKNTSKDLYLQVQHLVADMQDIKQEFEDLRAQKK
jgi:transcriptional regulator with XRE-family HTH domain